MTSAIFHLFRDNSATKSEVDNNRQITTEQPELCTDDVVEMLSGLEVVVTSVVVVASVVVVVVVGSGGTEIHSGY